MQHAAAALLVCAATAGSVELVHQAELQAEGACSSESVAWSDDGAHLAAGQSGPTTCHGKVTIWDASARTALRVVVPTGPGADATHGSVDCVDFANGFLAAGYQYTTSHSGKGQVSANVFADAAGAVAPSEVSVRLDSPSPWGMDQVALSPDGALLAGVRHAHLYIASTANGTLLAEKTLPGGSDLLRVVWSPNGRTLITTAKDAAVTMWEWDGATLTWRGKTRVAGSRLPSSGSCIGLALSRDGSQMALGCQDGQLRLYSVSGFALTEISNVRITTSRIFSVAFSPDAAYIAAGDGLNSGKARLFNASQLDTTPLAVVTLDRSAPVRGIAFHPTDAGLLATVSRHVGLWRVEPTPGRTPGSTPIPTTPTEKPTTTTEEATTAAEYALYVSVPVAVVAIAAAVGWALSRRRPAEGGATEGVDHNPPDVEMAPPVTEPVTLPQRPTRGGGASGGGVFDHKGGGVQRNVTGTRTGAVDSDGVTRNVNGTRTGKFDKDGAVRNANGTKTAMVTGDGEFRNKNGSKVGGVRSNGVVYNNNGSTIGFVRDDGTVQNANGSTIATGSGDRKVIALQHFFPELL